MRRYSIPTSTQNAADIFEEPEIDPVFILTSDGYHETYAVAALQAGKSVMLEKPLTLSLQSTRRILDAEAQSKNCARVFVGYMRHYAPSFVGAFKREVASIERILYARSRGIIGPNSSSTNPVHQLKGTPTFQRSQIHKRTELLDGLLQEAFEGQEVTKDRRDFCLFFGSLGGHDLSLMREALGFPESVAGVSVNEPFYLAILNCRQNGQAYAVIYESGIDAVDSIPT